MCSAPSINVPPPTKVELPPAPNMTTLVAPQNLQAGPKNPVEENPTLSRRGKRGLVIPLNRG